MGRIIAASIFVLLIYSAFHIIEAQEKGLSEMSLEELMGLEVVSSTQTLIPLQEAPSTISVVTGDQIHRWGIRRLSELIERLIPGCYVTEDGDDLIIGIRGLSSDINAKVLLLLNGHHYQTQWNNGLNSETELGLLQDIKQVEVINGSGGALYGSGATIGVINMITYTGADFKGVEATGNLGTGDYKRAEVMTGGMSDDYRTNYFFSGGGLTTDGYDNNNNDPLNISRYPPGWRFYGDITHKDFRLMSRLTRSARDFYGLPVSTTRPNIYAIYDSFFIDARQNFQLNDDLKLIGSLTFDTIETQRYDFTLGMKLRGVGEERYGLKMTGFYSGWEKHNLVFGAEYRRDEFGDDWFGDNFNFRYLIVDDVLTGVPTDTYPVRAITPYGRNVYAFFGQDAVTLNDRYLLLLGVRYDRIEAPQIKEPDAFTPRVALVIKPNERTVLKTMFSSGFRQPTAVLTGPDNIALGGAFLTEIESPEKMYSLELSGSYSLPHTANFTLNFFYNSLRDIHGLDPLRRPIFVNISVGRVDYVGFEAIADLELTENTFTRIVYQHVQPGAVVNDIFRTTVTPDEKHVLSYPQDVIKLIIDVPLNEWLSVNTNSNFVWNFFGRIPEAGPGADTGFFPIINANIVLDLGNHSELILSGYNLTNEDTKVPQTLNNFTSLAERNFNVTFAYSF